jgi:predicted TIM-barrel fold metal-dependent hydrolase
VPVAQQAAETGFFSRLAEQDRGTLPVTALIAGAWPESADFSARLERCAADGLVRGVRRVLHTQPAGFSLTPRWTENLRRLAQRGLTFDLCLRPPLLPDATELAARCPETRFVLDHCGVPNVAAGKLDPWRDALRQLAARPNVTCKFSGLASLCDPAQPLTPQVRPYFEHCLECFGADRMMWGSDWPLCDLTFNLAAWLQTTAELLGELSEGEQAAIAAGTARRVYRI